MTATHESRGAYQRDEEGLLWWDDPQMHHHLCVPKGMCKAILQELHDAPHGTAHAGQEQTLAAVKQLCYWKALKTNIKEYIEMCDMCQKIKHNRGKPPSSLMLLPIPPGPHHTVSLDFITGLPKPPGIKRYNWVLVVVDKYTCYGHS